MKPRQSDPDLKRHPYYWAFHFGFHFLMSILALVAGLILIFGEGEFLPGAALCGAAAFSMINGLGGYWELTGKIKRGTYLRQRN